jgi:hypothetical protein
MSHSQNIQSQSHFTADSQSVCLGVKPTLWMFDQILLPFQKFGSGICCPMSVVFRQQNILLFILGLFNDFVSDSGYAVSCNRMISKH